MILSYAGIVIDTHCHLDTPAFDDDRDVVVARATAAGVVGMLVPAIRPRTWAALGEFARRHAAAGVRHAIGVHPQIVPELEEDELGPVVGGSRSGATHGAMGDLARDLVARIVAAAADAVAIGECGLDGATGEHVLQEAIFRAHVRAARELGKPLVIHVLRAHAVAPPILREERAHEVGGVLHSYSGGAELVPVYRDLGLAFSFAGPVTYANARRPVEAARVVPGELLLAETDAPDQSPERGKRSEPALLHHVVAGLARARGAQIDEITAITAANARRIFRSW